MQLLALHLHLDRLGHRHLFVGAGTRVGLDAGIAVVFLLVVCGLMMGFFLEVAVIVIEVIFQPPKVQVRKGPPYENSKA